MPFDFSGSPIEIRRDLSDAFEREWRVLAAPGTWFTGAERVEIAAEGRRAIDGEPEGDGLAKSLRSAVRRVASESPSVDAGWVASLPADGVELTEYVEVIGIASRLSSVDFFHRAMGLPLEPLPQPLPGEPSRTAPPDGAVDGPGFVPMVPPIGVTKATSLVPPETDDWQRLSDATYMSGAEMGDPDFRRAMHRTQMELVAARTSQINECFY